jgi:hypothetical protein
MHHRLLITFSKEHAATSQDARDYAYETLDEQGFCADGRWGGLADWYVIGGRWSGLLSRHSWAQRIETEIEAAERENDIQICGTFYSDPAMQQLQRTLAAMADRLWDIAAPPEYKGIPYQRDSYKQDGYEDDAMLLSQELYDALLQEHEGSEWNDDHVDLDYRAVSADMVGSSWLVVGDYHS